MTECVDYVNDIGDIVLFGMVCCSLITHSSENGCMGKIVVLSIDPVRYVFRISESLLLWSDHDVVLTFEDHTAQRALRSVAAF